LGQRQNSGWTSISVMNYVAEMLEMVSLLQVRGYSMQA
jgi:hypothetical protein